MTRFVPKLSLGAVVLAIGFMVKILIPNFTDPDFYWHIKMGEYLMSTWPLPRSDVFTYTHTGSPWVLHEWLAQIVLYLVFHSAGYVGISILVAAMCAVCGWLTYLSCRRHMENPVHAIIAAMAACLILLWAAPRPQLFTFVGFSATLYILLEFKYAQRARLLALLPAIMLLWVNTHGGFFIGLLLIFLFAGSEWLVYCQKAEGALKAEQLRKLGLWSVAALLITLANPQNIQLWLYPFEAIIRSGAGTMINEWQSPSFHNPVTLGFLALVLLFSSIQTWSGRRPDLTEVVVPLVFIASAFISIRNLPLASMALMPFLAKNLRHVSLNSPAKGHVPVVQGGTLGTLIGSVSHKALTETRVSIINWILLIVVGIVLIFSYPQMRKREEAAVAAYLPVGATDFLVANHIRGRMFNSYRYGGYLIFRLYPAQKVFIYGWVEIYQDDFVKKLDDILQGRPNWKTLFDSYNIDYVICDSDVALRQLLLQEGDFRLVYDDGRSSVLLRKIQRFNGIKACLGQHLACNA